MNGDSDLLSDYPLSKTEILLTSLMTKSKCFMNFLQEIPVPRGQHLAVERENAYFQAIPFKGWGPDPAFLLDIQFRYSYIQPNKKRVRIIIDPRQGFCRFFVGRVIVAALLLFKQTCYGEESGVAFGRSRDVTI